MACQRFLTHMAVVHKAMPALKNDMKWYTLVQDELAWRLTDCGFMCLAKT